MVVIQCPKCSQEFDSDAFEKAIERGETFMVAKCPCGALIFGRKSDPEMIIAS